MVAHNTLPYYTNFNKKGIHTDNRNFQQVEVIIQEGIPIQLHSRKLTDPQKRYKVTEK